jgi:hypothetical protein
MDKLHFYDLTLQTCLTCPGGYVYIPLNHTCLLKIFNSNLQANNFIGDIPVAVGGMDTCPI